MDPLHRPRETKLHWSQQRFAAATPSQSPINIPQLFADALAHHQNGRLADAQALYRQIIQADPGHFDALNLLGMIAIQNGQQDDAVQLIGQAIALYNQEPSFYNNLGAALRDLGDRDPALMAVATAICLKPDHIEAYFNLGLTLKHSAHIKAALSAFNQALAIDPNFSPARLDQGMILRDLGRYDEAFASLAAAIQVMAHHVEQLFFLGNGLLDERQLLSAVTAFMAAVCIKPDYAQAYCNMGVALEGAGNPGAACTKLSRALAIRPIYPEAQLNLGLTFETLERLDDANDCYSKVLDIRPDDPHANFNQSLLRLLSGDLLGGWPQYEWRSFGAVDGYRLREFAQPQWRGEDIAGRTILVHTEQGFGDAIQFARYAKRVSALGARVVLEVQRPLLRLFSKLEGVDQLLVRGDVLPDFDYHCPLLSLPLAFGTVIGNIPAQIPYLFAEPPRVDAWRNRFAPKDFCIGINWQGNPQFKKDKDRSIPLKHYLRLARIPGVRLFSLQANYGLDQIDQSVEARSIEIFGPQFADGTVDFVDTAALMMNLDLFITSDTAVCHLAGALGVPVWVALTKHPDWRWLMEGEQCPWYPTMRLFRQKSRGDWDDVFARIEFEVANLARHKGRQSSLNASDDL